MKKSYAEQMSDFVAALRFTDLPPAVVRNGKLRILDILGICLASAQMDFARFSVATMQEWGGKEESSVIGFTGRLPMVNAALANGLTAHGLDYDDTHTESITHASACVVPTALAVGEAVGASGKEVLTAAVAGWETLTRIGMAAPGRFHSRGFHATSICGTFAAALTAGKLLGLSPATLSNALGICGSLTSGSFEYLADGSWVKRLHPGWAAHAGIVAALLAQKGFSGPHTIFEGRFGLYRTHLGEGEFALERLTAGLGDTWETLNISFKPYPCCHYNHAFIDCVRFLQERHAIRAEEVAEVECLIGEGQVPIVCEPAEIKHRPQTPYHAQFSLPFAVALMLKEGRVGIDEFSEERLRDEELLALARRVTYTVDPTSSFPTHFPGWVKIRLKDGRIVEHQEPYNRGGPVRPLTEGELIDKFVANARRTLAKERVERIREGTLALDGCQDIRDLTALCRIPG